MAGKRSNPVDLLKQKQQIVKDMEDRENVPQSQRMYPNLLEQGRRVLQKASQARRDAQFPLPDEGGAKVVGFRKPNTKA